MHEPYRGEVWRVRLDPITGDEMGKTRPVVVLSPDSIGRLALRTVAPVTDWKPRYAGYPWMVHLPLDPGTGLSKESAVDAFQVRSVSVERFVGRLGALGDVSVGAIAEAVAVAVGYEPGLTTLEETA